MATDASKPLVTIAVIAKDGAQHLGKALDAASTLFAELDDAYDCHALLVDSASTDETPTLMQEFANGKANVRVFQLSGRVNASAARNVYLHHLEPGYLIAIDGDIAIDPEFVRAAVAEMAAGNADVAYGQLPEYWYDASGTRYGGQDDRYKVSRREYIEWFKGAYMMSPRAVARNFRYDESLERLEDIEYSLRVAEEFKILCLPLPMGIHHTDGYHSRTRLKDFIRAGYQVPAGQFIRANLFKPKRLIRVRRAFVGYLVGLCMLALVVVGLVLWSPLIALGGVALLLIDALRFRLQGRAHEFLPLRIIGAWQLLVGFFKPHRAVGPYEVRELTGPN